ncbi:MAG: S8 family serine peptidase [Polyangiaceae bacterium]|nr:S8 family serine peptidase [Polyangiaceae bacterium]
MKPQPLVTLKLGKLRTLLIGGLVTSTLAWPHRVRAELPFRQLVVTRHAPLDRHALPKAFENTHNRSISLLVTHAKAPEFSSAGLFQITPGLSSVEVPTSQLSRWVEGHPDWQWQWAPRRRLLLDQVEPFVHARAARQDSGLTGVGTLIGIIDSGADVTHPDLRHADGTTRVRRLLDFSTPPRGLARDLENEYGCTSSGQCSVLTDTEINAFLKAGDTERLPLDVLGHGTHVASLAAGNGAADPRFVGVAPEADLIVARVTRDQSGGVLDADVLRAVSFVFQEAAALGLPAVVNLSLGSDFGPHDGSSELERALAGFVGPEFKGRSIVVAAGNSGAVYSGITQRYPGPFGIHTESFVARNGGSLIPVLSPHTLSPTTRATVFTWLSFLPGDSVSIGVEDGSGTVAPPVAPGAAGTFTKGSLEITILNGTAKGSSATAAPQEGSSAASAPEEGSAIVILDGSWPSGSVFGLRLVGHGTAQLWLESSGDLLPGGATPGALFPNAQRAGTISIPAAQSELIAVGSSTHRTAWTDYAGTSVPVSIFGMDAEPLDSKAVFSAEGPNAWGDLKPEILAPGLGVAAALSAQADPRGGNRRSEFGGAGLCEKPQEECFVLSDNYAVSAGTSISAPLVAGAVALLLERNPNLTQPELRNSLIASSRLPKVADGLKAGPGVLDIAQLLTPPPITKEPPQVDAARSWLSLSSSFIRPAGRSRLVATAQLRDKNGNRVRLPLSDISLTATPATLLEPVSELAPGAWQAAFTAPEGSAAEALRVHVSVRGQKIAETTLPIAVDDSAAKHPFSARGGCAVAFSRASDGANAQQPAFFDSAIRLTAWALVGLLTIRRRYSATLAK